MAYMICGTGKHRYGDEYRGECPYCHVPCYPGRYTNAEVEVRNRGWLERITTSIDKQLSKGLNNWEVINNLPHLPWERETEERLNKKIKRGKDVHWTKSDLMKLKKLWDENGASTPAFWKHQAEKNFGRSLYSIEHQLRMCVHDEIFDYALKSIKE